MIYRYSGVADEFEVFGKLICCVGFCRVGIFADDDGALCGLVMGDGEIFGGGEVGAACEEDY